MKRFICLLLLGAAFNTAFALEPPRVASYAGYTRLVFDVPTDAPYRLEALGAALRITFSSNTVKPVSLRLTKPEVAGYTLANSNGNVVALIATPQGVSSRRGFRSRRLEPSVSKTGFRLVLDFSGAYADISALPAVAALKLQKAKGQVFTVVLDPGHGGTDPGALGNGLLESNLNLNVAFRVKKWLENSGVGIEMTRTDNRIFSNNKRSDLNARAEASRGKTAFVSIHANARPRSLWNSTFGMEVYYFDSVAKKPWLVASAPEPRAAGSVDPRAAGSVDPRATLDPQPADITVLPEIPSELPATNVALAPSTPETPITPNANGFGAWLPLEPAPVVVEKPASVLPQLNRTDASRNLAAGVLSQMLGATAALNRGVQVGDYYVIRNAESPAILVEMGFVTHPIEAAQLRNSNYLDRVSYGLALGILEYIEGLSAPIDALAPLEGKQ